MSERDELVELVREFNGQPDRLTEALIERGYRRSVTPDQIEHAQIEVRKHTTAPAVELDQARQQNERLKATVADLRAQLARDRAEDEALQVSLSHQADAIIELNAEVADLRAQLAEQKQRIDRMLRTAQVWDDLSEAFANQPNTNDAKAHHDTLRHVARVIRDQLAQDEPLSQGRYVARTVYDASTSAMQWATVDTESDYVCIHTSQKLAEDHARDFNEVGHWPKTPGGPEEPGR